MRRAPCEQHIDFVREILLRSPIPTLKNRISQSPECFNDLPWKIYIDNGSSLEDELWELKQYSRSGGKRADSAGKRSPLPHRTKNANGRTIPALLAADLHVRPAASPGVRTAGRTPSWRELRCVSRPQRRCRCARRILPASRRIACLGARRRLWNPLHLPMLRDVLKH
jgi:hypothetical protein